ncbi:transglycosylase family protein [Candidatus Saccharibacteria bacterium]|nr:transglycosylase family protein [Candidatus Saccharibacteria bacterium]
MKKSNLLLGLTILVFVNMIISTYRDTGSASAQQSNIDLDLFSINQQKTPKANDVLALSTNEPSAPQSTETDSSIEAKTAETKEVQMIVTSGDTLIKIAKAHNTTYQKLFDANPSIDNPDVISVGQVITIPDPDAVLESRPLPSKPRSTPPTNNTKSKSSSTRTQTHSVQSSSAPAVANGSVWDALARCESGGNWQINTGNGYYGGLQFSAATWRAVGGTGLPHQHNREEQIARAEILLARSGWGQWPACTKKLGLR